MRKREKIKSRKVSRRNNNLTRSLPWRLRKLDPLIISSLWQCLYLEPYDGPRRQEWQKTLANEKNNLH